MISDLLRPTGAFFLGTLTIGVFTIAGFLNFRRHTSHGKKPALSGFLPNPRKPMSEINKLLYSKHAYYIFIIRYFDKDSKMFILGYLGKSPY